ncbi:hypothetical protein [Saccharopolyspora sp. NPDC002686]|uniref:hypothetical protein n=1 Tax=Saccharopolyspora sp. NPDC002686 TaxID=3154541 RepID=UPI0033230243
MTQHMFADLPAKPDVQTGEPRPPEAPLVLGKMGPATTDLDQAGPVPDGRGPALDVFIQDRRTVLLGSLIVMGVIVIGASLQRGSFEWMSDPVMLGIVGVAGLIMVLRGWSTRLTAGSDWLRVNRKWIDTYKITNIHLYGVIVGWTLVLQDENGRKVRTYLGSLEANRELWALVYNGLAHSVRTGATFNAMAGNMLKLRQFTNKG